MNNQEIIEKLDGYCEWCKAQGGNCQAHLDGCSIFDIITELEQQPGRIARFFWRLFGVTKFGLPHIKAGEIQPPPEATEVSKGYGRVLDNVVAAFATTDDEIIRQKVQAAVDEGRKVCRELDRQAEKNKQLKEEISNIETHIEMLIDPKELERIGADNHPKQRDLHHRIMRILEAYNDQAL